MLDPRPFKLWPLHDATVGGIEVRWKERTCVISLSAFLNPGQDAMPCQIRFVGVESVHVPMNAPWGWSVSINAHEQDGRTYKFEMQSGDSIQVAAAGAELVRVLN